MNKPVILLLTLICVISKLSGVVYIVPRSDPGAGIGKAFGEGFAKGFEEARIVEEEKQLREQLQRERIRAEQTDQYNDVINQLSFEKSHPTLTLSDDLKKTFQEQFYIKMPSEKTLKCIFKRKLHRVLTTKSLVEWLWALEITNETPKKLFSSGKIEYSTARFKIELVDSNNFVLSTCIIYNNLFLKRGETTTLDGKWVIPYDQASQVTNFKISIGN